MPDPLRRSTTRLLVALFIVATVCIAAWMTYVILTETADPENQRRLEEVEREAAADQARDTTGAAHDPGP